MKENKLLEDLEEKSEVYEMLMNEPPKLYLKSGFGLISFFLLLVTIMCYFIDFSNYISSEVKIVSSNPRAPLISGVNGRIINLLQNNTQVKTNDIIAAIENPAKADDVILLEEKIESINSNYVIQEVTFNSNLKLGDLQSSFSNFLNAKNELDIFNNIHSTKDKASNLKRELNEGFNLIKNLEEERKSLKEKVDLSESQLLRSKILYGKGVIALNEYEIAKQNHVDIVNSYQSKLTNIKQTQINNQKTSSTISSTINENDEANMRVFSNFRTALEQLKSDIGIWKKKYLIVSPIEGVFVLNDDVWASQQVIEAGKEIGSIVPNKEEIFAIAKMPEFESGKVLKNNDVLIYLNSYNFSEYGMIKGIVKNISPVPKEGFYNVEITLPNKLKTDLNYSIPYSPELSGQVTKSHHQV